MPRKPSNASEREQPCEILLVHLPGEVDPALDGFIDHVRRDVRVSLSRADAVLWLLQLALEKQTPPKPRKRAPAPR